MPLGDAATHLLDERRHLLVGLGLACLHLLQPFVQSLRHPLDRTCSRMLDLSGQCVKSLRCNFNRGGGLHEHVAHATHLRSKHSLHLLGEAGQYVGQQLVDCFPLAAADRLNSIGDTGQRLFQAITQAFCNDLPEFRRSCRHGCDLLLRQLGQHLLEVGDERLFHLHGLSSRSFRCFNQTLQVFLACAGIKETVYQTT